MGGSLRHFPRGGRLRVGARVAITDWSDAAIDYGWSGVGGELRVGLPESHGRLPFAISVGARSSAVAPRWIERVRDQRELRAGLELYPDIPLPDHSSPNRLHGVISLGFSRGLHYHKHDLDKSDPLYFVRDEDRFEGTLGVDWRRGRAVLSLIALPYFVSKASTPETVSCGIAHCASLSQGDLVSYSQSFGISLAFTLGVSLN